MTYPANEKAPAAQFCPQCGSHVPRIAELERQLAFANDTAAKGELARTEAAGMQERIQELEKLAAKWSDEIAVVYNEYSGGQRAGLTQAAAELRSLMESATK